MVAKKLNGKKYHVTKKRPCEKENENYIYVLKLSEKTIVKNLELLHTECSGMA